ncbi:uracil-DNA glycosylase family protein [Halovenus halobia]|uniref:uracil-DNA glycosylase family protein n=1 Tax=Halovenus halobia TaxID=3396622 RepID=UPI003F54E99F
MEFVADRSRNPFGMRPPCEQSIPGYGPTDADFHVIGDHPDVHGGLDTQIPFTDQPWSARFFEVLAGGGLIDEYDLGAGRVDTARTYFSYIHACAVDGEPSESSYADLEPFFDAELRAITAHVLLPVGERATRHVFEQYTALDADRASEMGDLHATEQRGSGWLIIPIKAPNAWTKEDEQTLVDRLRNLLASEYHQISDLGRFLPDGEPYFVR